jgi:hypothetical protein
MSLLLRFWSEDSGVVISAELVLVLTVAVVALLVGLNEASVAITTELNDVSNAVGALNQDYYFTGFIGGNSNTKFTSSVYGARFYERQDDGDVNGTCDIVNPVCTILYAEGSWSN